jgi:hypothetical protein
VSATSGRRHYVTLADRNYLTRGLALIESLARHERRDHVLYFVCLDELTRTVLTALRHPNVVPVALHHLERNDHALLATRAGRSLVEYYWTLTPTLILRLIERHPDIDVLTYLDSDLYFFSSPDPVFDELGRQSVLIHEHRYTRELAYLERESGRFNVGLLCFRRDQTGLEVLRWWRERCLEWCFARTEDGKMGDQMYLDDWPRRFPGVTVLQHPGAGLAPWNHGQYRVQPQPDGPATVDGRPLVFFHFHSLAVPHPSLLLTSKHPVYPMSEPILRACYLPYAEALWRQARVTRLVLPAFSFGMNDQVTFTPQLTLLARQDAPALELGPLQRLPLDPVWSALVAAPEARPAGGPPSFVNQPSSNQMRGPS